MSRVQHNYMNATSEIGTHQTRFFPAFYWLFKWTLTNYSPSILFLANSIDTWRGLMLLLHGPTCCAFCIFQLWQVLIWATNLPTMFLESNTSTLHLQTYLWPLWPNNSMFASFEHKMFLQEAFSLSMWSFSSSWQTCVTIWTNVFSVFPDECDTVQHSWHSTETGWMDIYIVFRRDL